MTPRGLVLVLACAGLGALAGGVAAEGLPESVAPSLLPNYVLVRPDVASAGLPTESGMQQLRALGFRVVVDLRAPQEGLAEEQAAVKAAGLRYVSIPITAKAFSRADAEKLARVLDEPDRGPVLVHCATGNRVGAVWTVLEVTKGRPYDQAEAEGRKLGLRSPDMVAAVKRVLGEDPAIR